MTDREQVLARLREVSRQAPRHGTDPGAMDELVREIEEMAELRRRATTEIL